MAADRDLHDANSTGNGRSGIALVTGATGAIGVAIARELARHGFDLILVSRNRDRLTVAAKELEDLDVHVDCAVCDVKDPAAVGALFDRLARFGQQLKVLVNCAGISGGGLTAQVSDDLWRDVIDTNLSGTFYVTVNALRRDVIARGGRIVNIASTGGKQGVLHGAPYSASKHGVVGFTKSLGLEQARNGSGITVNAVCPGFVESEMAERVRAHYASIWKTDGAETRRRIEDRVPLGRYVEPEEVAAMVGYLVSPAAGAVTAQALNVCGGLGNY
jgi:ketoreductase